MLYDAKIAPFAPPALLNDTHAFAEPLITLSEDVLAVPDRFLMVATAKVDMIYSL